MVRLVLRLRRRPLPAADVRHHDRFADARRRHPRPLRHGTVGTRRRRLRRHALRHGRHVAPGRGEPPPRPAHRAGVCRRASPSCRCCGSPGCCSRATRCCSCPSSRWSSSSCSCRSWPSGTGITPFHPHHIAERYALLTLIVLGEVILASVQAVQGALGQGAEPRPARHSSSGGCSSSSRCGGSTSSAITPGSSRAASGAPSSPATATTSSSPRWPPPGRRSRRPSTSSRARRTRRCASVGLALAGAVAVYALVPHGHARHGRGADVGDPGRCGGRRGGAPRRGGRARRSASRCW